MDASAQMIAFLLLIMILAGSSIIFSGIKGAVWVPAFSKDTNEIIKELNIKQGSHVYEFGCGDGRFLRKAANLGAHSVGYEINPFLGLLARLLSIGKDVKIEFGDAWAKSFSKADITFVFLMPKFMERLGEKLSSEMKQGSVIATYAFPIPNMNHFKFTNNCYFYKI